MCVTVAGFGEGELAQRPSLVPEETRSQRRIYGGALVFYFPSTASALCSGCGDVTESKKKKKVKTPPEENYHTAN